MHWSVAVGAALLLLGSIGSVAYLAAAAIALAAYFAAVLLHEWGHVVLARRRSCQVYTIELYPFVGLTRFQQPWARFDHCVIAWGGVLFQGAVGIPVLIWITVVGYTPIEVVNPFLAVFGYLTLITLPVNLLPLAPMDGAVAWGIVPLLWHRWRNGRRRRGKGEWLH
jgi:stage IV sporulation protein FB